MLSFIFTALHPQFVYNSYEAKVRTNGIPKPIIFKLNRLNVIDV